MNQKKTKVFDSLRGYEREAMTFEHRLVTSLAMVVSRGQLSTSQQRAFQEFVERERSATPEGARLWKRTYALAERMRSPALVPAAFDDLARYPTAGGRISSYLRSLNWPSGTADRAVKRIRNAPTDSEAIALMRALVSANQPFGNAVISGLREVAKSSAASIHPYVRVLAHAYLILGHGKVDADTAKSLLELARCRRSSLARRVAIELLWLIPEQRSAAAKLIQKDPSLTVRGLAFLPAMTRQEMEWGQQTEDGQMTDDPWRSIGAQLRLNWMNVHQ
ncbi:MAG: hypothetical protein F4X40_06190 [Chloroflexi bacterium]|nr:hypothetical protein [Chloroflexota bacterium]